MAIRVSGPGSQSVAPVKVPRVRRTLVEGLQLEFERFLEDADLGDLYLLNELLRIHNDENTAAAEPDAALSSPFLKRLDELMDEAVNDEVPTLEVN